MKVAHVISMVRCCLISCDFMVRFYGAILSIIAAGEGDADGRTSSITGDINRRRMY